MKKLIFFVISFGFCFTSTVFAQINLDSGLVAKYYFNGNANDESGNNNNGTVNGATLTMDRFGLANSAYHFNGTSDYILVNNSSSLNIINSISICVWFQAIKPSIGTSFGNLVCKAKTNNSRQYYLSVTDSTLFGDSLYFGLIKTTDESVRPAIHSNYWDYKWHFVVVTYDYVNGIVHIYLDNQLKKSSTVGQFNLEQSTIPLLIGCTMGISTGYRSFYNGDIDDIRIYDRAINQAEVTALFNETATSSETNSNISENEISIYPNPANTFITICTKNTNASLLEIIDFSGKTIIKGKLKTSLDISNLTCGIYIVKVSDKKGIILKADKIVKE